MAASHGMKADICHVPWRMSGFMFLKSGVDPKQPFSPFAKSAPVLPSCRMAGGRRMPKKIAADSTLSGYFNYQESRHVPSLYAQVDPVTPSTA